MYGLNLNDLKNSVFKGKNDTYKISKDLGRGGQGSVFSCVDTSGKEYALKVFSRFIKKNPLNLE